ncbi:MAG TPA: CHAT domain-containing protein [Coleofasciculaceae cyanobacterium]
MASKRHLHFFSFQALLKLAPVLSRRLVRRSWLTYLVLVCLTTLLCIVSPPVFAYLSSSVPITQAIPAVQLWQQGRDSYEAGQFTAARQVWQQAAQAYQSAGDRINQAMVLSNLALVNQQLGQFSDAKNAIATSLNLLQSEPDTPDRRRILAQALTTQGNLQIAQGQAEQALTTLQQAAELYKQVDDEAGAIRSFLNQAQALHVMGLYRREVAILAQAYQTLQAQPNSSLKATGLRYLGNALRSVGYLEQGPKIDGITIPSAEQVLTQSLELAKKIASPSDISAALLGLGNTARTQQKTEAALDYYQQAVATANSPTIRIQALVNQFSLMVEGDKKEEMSSLTQPLLTQIQTELANLPPSRLGIYARINFAGSLMKMGDGDSSIPYRQDIAQILATAVQQAENLNDPQAHAYALGSLGGLYEKTQQWKEAQSLTQEALALAQANNAPDIAYRWQWQLARLLKNQGQEDGAIAAYKEAVNTLQSVRSDLVGINSDVQFSFREGVEPVYRELVALLLKADSTKTSEQQLEDARQVIESLQVAELDDFFRSACLNAQPIEIDSIDQKAAIIYPIILADRLEVILRLPNQPLRHYPANRPQKEVEDTVIQLRRELPRRFSEDFFPLSEQVYNWLIRPAEKDLAASGVQTLVFVLDGPLRNIPMGTLYDGKQFLIEKYAIALTPGLQLLESKPLARGELKVLKAGLSEARGGFSPLPGVEAELNQLQALVPGEMLFNQEFTKANIQNAIESISFPIVHLATHGKFSSNAEETFILTWDGQFNVNQLSNLLRRTDERQSTPIELLVLSACQTAIGDNRAALGIAGVAIRAGARSTLATLWSVSDETTAALMEQFYQELTKTNVTKAEALRRAQLSILQNSERQDPYYWAPYILVGNWL